MSLLLTKFFYSTKLNKHVKIVQQPANRTLKVTNG